MAPNFKERKKLSLTAIRDKLPGTTEATVMKYRGNVEEREQGGEPGEWTELASFSDFLDIFPKGCWNPKPRFNQDLSLILRHQKADRLKTTITENKNDHMDHSLE